MRTDKIIAVDFDGVLCENRWPSIGVPDHTMIGIMKMYKAAGWRIILWTCRSGALLNEAVEWCRNYGLIFDAVNENLPEIVKEYGRDSRKVTATMYIDDHSFKPEDLIHALWGMQNALSNAG